MPDKRRLPDKEWLKRYKFHQVRQTKRIQAAKIFLKKNHPEMLMCNICNVFGYVKIGKITDSAVRLYCSKCKNKRIIKVSLPKRFIPTK